VRLTLVSDRLAVDDDGAVYGLHTFWNRAHGAAVPTWLLYQPQYAETSEFHWQRPEGAGGGSLVCHDLDEILAEEQGVERAAA
jgi:hypothetical protein